MLHAGIVCVDRARLKATSVCLSINSGCGGRRTATETGPDGMSDHASRRGSGAGCDAFHGRASGCADGGCGCSFCGVASGSGLFLPSGSRGPSGPRSRT